MFTIRVETVLVVGLLLFLLLQLPRLDDPPDLRLVNGGIARVDEIQGAALYVDLGGGDVALVYVSELRMHADATGTAYVTRLDGLVVRRGGDSERIRFDASERAAVLGWRPVAWLDGLVVPGGPHNRHPHEFRQMRWRKAISRGEEVLFVMGRVEGQNLVTGGVVTGDFDANSACPAVPLLAPVDVGSSFGCSMTASRSASGAGGSGEKGCFWALAGAVCWQGKRELELRPLVAWTAGYPMQ